MWQGDDISSLITRTISVVAMGLKPEFAKKNIALKIIANPNLASKLGDFRFRQSGIAQTLHISAKYNYKTGNNTTGN